MTTSQDEHSQAAGSGVVNPSPQASPAGAESARRALEVLLSFSRERHTQSVKDLAQATGIPLPSAYRYVGLLRDVGLLLADGQGRYHLSPRFSALARAAEAAQGIIALAHPTMRCLVDATGETVLLSRLIDQTPVCVHRIESSQRLRFSFDPGQPLPLDRSATSRVLLSSAPPGLREALLAHLRDTCPERAPVLEREIAQAARRGWATAEEELDEGIWAASAAVRDGRTNVCAALTLTSPIARTPRGRQDYLLQMVLEAAGEITGLLTRPRAAIL